MMLAYVVTPLGESVGLVLQPDGLQWQSESEPLKKLADRLVPTNQIPESGGNPAAWAVSQLTGYIGGRSRVLGHNIPAADRHYGA